MSNAKIEFLKLVESVGVKVKCASLVYGACWWDEDQKCYYLPVGYSDNTYDLFLHSINFDYDSGYGSQELFGTIWFEDGTWAERREYDGSEWWEHRYCPEIPEELKQ
jgi:hypothetical protein